MIRLHSAETVTFIRRGGSAGNSHTQQRVMDSGRNGGDVAPNQGTPRTAGNEQRLRKCMKRSLPGVFRGHLTLPTLSF